MDPERATNNDPEQRTQDEIRDQGDEEGPDAITAREGLEEALMEADASEQGEQIGESLS